MFLLLCGGGVVFTGCSSDDGISDPAPIESPDDNKTTGDESTGNKPTGGDTTGGEEITKVPLFTVVGLCGSEVVPMTIPEGGDGTEQYLTFVYAQDTTIKGLDGKDKALKDGWGGIANPQLKIVPQTALFDDNTPNWTMDYASPYDTPIYVMPGKDWIKLSYRSKNNSNPGSISLDGLILDEEYTLCVKFDAANNQMDFKVLGRSVDIPGMQIVVSTGTGDPFSIPMTRTGTAYTYEFIAAKTLNLSYYFKCPSLNTTYYGEGKELVKLDNTDDALSKGNTLSIVKNYKYTIKIKAGDILFGDNGTFAGFDGKTSWNVEKGPPILSNGVLLWENTNDMVYFWNGSYTFVAQGTSVGFKLLRDDSDTMAWGGVSITPGKTMTLTYKTTLVPDENGFAYAVPEEKKSACDEVGYIKADGLTEGKGYKVSFADVDADHDKFEICLIELPLADFTGMKLKGAFDGWDEANGWIGFDLAKQSDGTWTVDFTVTKDTNDFDFGIFSDGPDKWCNGETITVGDDYTTIGYGGSNATICGAEKGNSYTLIVKPGYGTIEAKIIKK